MLKFTTVMKRRKSVFLIPKIKAVQIGMAQWSMEFGLKIQDVKHLIVMMKMEMLFQIKKYTTSLKITNN